MKATKKLIEVALPLEAINKASAREKSIRHGHPSTLHLWWARRPLAAARAVIFSQMVDDPSEYTDVLLSDPVKRRQARSELKKRLAVWEEKRKSAEQEGPKPTVEEVVADLERERLFRIIEDLVQWENTHNEEVLQRARDEIWQSWRRACAENADHPRAKELFDRHKLPAFHDLFAGGGSLPLEAQRLGLEAYATDLNPVAVLINKAMIEIPPKFAGLPPVNPEAQEHRGLFKKAWSGAQGLAEDVRYYGRWMRDEAMMRIGHFYPKIEITDEMANDPDNPRPDLKPLVGQKLTVIAWLWARTVKSPNPAFAHVDVPLVSTFMVSTKEGHQAFVVPLIERGGYRFTVRVGKPTHLEATKNGTRLSRGASFQCLMSGTPISSEYMMTQAKTGRMGARMMAIVAEGPRARVYLPPTRDMETIAQEAKPAWKPDVDFFPQALGFRVGNYGMSKWSDLFTPRQLVALTAFSDLVIEARQRAQSDALTAKMPDAGPDLSAGGTGAQAYAEAIGVYLSFVLDKTIAGSSTGCTWMHQRDSLYHTFAKQTLSMTWDFAEVNVLADCTRSLSESAAWTAESIEGLVVPLAKPNSRAEQADAATQDASHGRIVSTDPPYFDNIGYADLSDFFYVWLRRSQRLIFPALFSTLTVPKAEELVATPGRHGGREKAEAFFLRGMTEAMHHLAKQAHPAFPVTIFYAVPVYRPRSLMAQYFVSQVTARAVWRGGREAHGGGGSSS